MKIKWQKLAAFTLSEIMIVLVVISIIALATYKITASRSDYVYKYMHAAALKDLKRGVGEIIADGTYNSVSKKTERLLPTTIYTGDGSSFCERFSELTNTIGAISCTQTVPDGTTDFLTQTPNFVASNGIKFYNFGSAPTGTVPNRIYTVYVDIDGNNGTSKLNKDVWPFYININGAITPLPPPNPTCGSTNGVHYEQHLPSTDILLIDNDTGATCSTYFCGDNPPSGISSTLNVNTITNVDNLSGYVCSTYPCGSSTLPGTGPIYTLAGDNVTIIVTDKKTGLVCTAQPYPCGSGVGGKTYSLSGNTVNVTDVQSGLSCLPYTCGAGPSGKSYSLSGSTVSVLDLTSSPNLTCATYPCGSSTAPGTGSHTSMSGTTISTIDNNSNQVCSTRQCGSGGLSPSLSNGTIYFYDTTEPKYLCSSRTCGSTGTVTTMAAGTTTIAVTDKDTGLVCNTYACGTSGKGYSLTGTTITVTDTTFNIACTTYTCGSTTAPGTGSTSTTSGTHKLVIDNTSGLTCSDTANSCPYTTVTATYISATDLTPNKQYYKDASGTCGFGGQLWGGASVQYTPPVTACATSCAYSYTSRQVGYYSCGGYISQCFVYPFGDICNDPSAGTGIPLVEEVTCTGNDGVPNPPPPPPPPCSKCYDCPMTTTYSQYSPGDGTCRGVYTYYDAASGTYCRSEESSPWYTSREECEIY